MATIIVETGEIIEGANSFVTFDDYLAYFSLGGGSEDQITDNLVLAFRAMNNLYYGKLQGTSVSSEQEGLFPRQNMINIETGFVIGPTVIPKQVKYWQMEAAKILLENGSEALEPTLERVGKVKSYTSKIGPIEESVEFESGGQFDTQYFSRLNNLMYPYLKQATVVNMPFIIGLF